MTWTRTPNADISKTASETVANANDVITYTIFVDVTGGPVSNVSITDILPAPLSLVGFGNVPPGGVTSWNATTKTLGWSSSSPIPPGIYTITYQAQVTATPHQGSVMTNHAQLSYSGLTSPKTATVDVALAMTAPVLYPNPLRDNGLATLQVVLNKPQEYLTVKVFTTAFRKVFADTVKTVPSGIFLYGLDTSRFQGSTAANGLYYVVITTPSNRWNLKLLILK